MMCQIANIYICIANIFFGANQPLGFGLLFSKNISLFPNFAFSVFKTCRPFFQILRLALFLAKPYYEKLRIDLGIISVFGNKTTLHCKLPVKSWFLGICLISIFSL